MWSGFSATPIKECFAFCHRLVAGSYKNRAISTTIISNNIIQTIIILILIKMCFILCSCLALGFSNCAGNKG